MRVIAVDENQYRSECIFIDETDETDDNEENMDNNNINNNYYKDIRNMVENREQLNKLACENRGIYLLKHENDCYFIHNFKTSQVITYSNVKQLFTLVQTIDSLVFSNFFYFFYFFIFLIFFFVVLCIHRVFCFVYVTCVLFMHRKR